MGLANKQYVVEPQSAASPGAKRSGLADVCGHNVSSDKNLFSEEKQTFFNNLLRRLASLTDRRQERLGAAVFGHEAVHTSCMRTRSSRTVVVYREHDRTCASAVGAKFGSHAQAVDGWHLDVEDNHIRIELFELVQCLVAVGCFAQHDEVRFKLEATAEAASNRGMIIHDKESDWPLRHMTQFAASGVHPHPAAGQTVTRSSGVSARPPVG
jgi:hypothetical protein